MVDCAPAPLRVAGHDLLTSEGALECGRRREPEDLVGLLALLEVRRAQQPEVCEWRAERRHLPVDDHREPRGRVDREDRVVELVVAMHERGLVPRRDVRLEPFPHRVDVRYLARGVVLPLTLPAAHLALEVSALAPDLLQTGAAPLSGVDLDQPIGELLNRASSLDGVVEPRREVLTDDVALYELH